MSDIHPMLQILESSNVLLWDTSGLKAPGIKLYFQENFKTLVANRGKLKVPAFCYRELARPADDMAIVAVDKQLFALMPEADSYRAVFAQLKQAGCRSVAVVLNDTSKRCEVFDAANAAGVFVKFYFLNDAGQLTEPPKPAPKSRPADAPKDRSNARPSAPVASKPAPRGFVLKTVPERISIAPLPVTEPVNIGSTVTDSKGKTYRLMRREAVGNHSFTYSTDAEGVWVKLFDRQGLNTFMEAKVRRMLSHPISHSGICWPMDVVTDTDGKFRGYTLPPFKGKSLHLAVFKRAGIESNFPDWTKVDICDLTVTILSKIRFLHSQNVLMGCINPAAILVDSKDRVYFTDTDNYQIEGFPSTAYNLSFTPPELLDKKMYLATRDNENFAVAQLVFMLMMPGKTPYADGSDREPRELIRRRKFSYAAGRFTGSNVLPGMWRMMWSHLDSLRGSFYNVFHQKGKFFQPEERRNVSYWENAVKYYREYLLQPENRASRVMYPTTFKKEPGETFYRCRFCGMEHPREYFDREYFDYFQICNGCLEKQSNVSFTCEDCGRTFYYSNRTALFHQLRKTQDATWKDQKHCADCKKKTMPCRNCGKELPVYRLRHGLCSNCNQTRLNSVYERRTCRDCGNPFDITVKDHEYYMSRPDMHIPTRCKPCREQKKNGGSYNPTPPPKKGFFGRFF